MNIKIFQNIVLFLVLIVSTIALYAVETIDIEKGIYRNIKVAINKSELVQDQEDKTQYGLDRISERILDITRNDLALSGGFVVQNEKGYIDGLRGSDITPHFLSWKNIGTNFLLNTTFFQGKGNFYLKISLWDILLEKKIFEHKYEFKLEDIRLVAHKISDKIYELVTGYKGHFSNKIVYVSEQGDYKNRIKKIAIMDYDGANHQYLTTGTEIVATPKFSYDGNKILYVSYKKNIPRVYIMDLRTKESKLVGEFSGMAFAPEFAPDNLHILFSIAKNGESHIYEYNLEKKKLVKLTYGKSINTSPSYSPDGNYIIFNSNRTGLREIFIMNKHNLQISKISPSRGTYAEPKLSVLNDLVFTKIGKSGFTIGVMKLKNFIPVDDTERIISTGYIVESPCFSSNGRVILFTRGYKLKPYFQDIYQHNIKNLHRIFAIDITGYNERIIPTPFDASDPSLSKN